MKELHIKNEYIKTWELKDKNHSLKIAPNEYDNIVRVYPHSPKTYALQIRYYGGINEYRAGKKRTMISHVNLTFEEIEEIYLYTKKCKDEKKV